MHYASQSQVVGTVFFSNSSEPSIIMFHLSESHLGENFEVVHTIFSCETKHFKVILFLNYLSSLPWHVDL